MNENEVEDSLIKLEKWVNSMILSFSVSLGITNCVTSTHTL